MGNGNKGAAATPVSSLIHWIDKWQRSRSDRWDRQCRRMVEAGLRAPSCLVVHGEGFVRVKLFGQSGRDPVLVELTDGNPITITEYAMSPDVQVEVLTAIRTNVTKAFDEMDHRLDELIVAMPKLIEEFRCDVAEEHLEQEADSNNSICECSHDWEQHKQSTASVCSVYGCKCYGFKPAVPK